MGLGGRNFILTDHQCLKSQKQKFSPKHSKLCVLAEISLRTSGQKLRSGPPNAGKQAFWDPRQPDLLTFPDEKTVGLKNFGLIFQFPQEEHLEELEFPRPLLRIERFVPRGAAEWSEKLVPGSKFRSLASKRIKSEVNFPGAICLEALVLLGSCPRPLGVQKICEKKLVLIFIRAILA